MSAMSANPLPPYFNNPGLSRNNQGLFGNKAGLLRSPTAHKKKLLTARSLFYRVSLGLLSQFAVRTQHVHNLVDVQLLHVLTSGLQILARIEVIGMLSQMLTNGSGHSQTRV